MEYLSSLNAAGQQRYDTTAVDKLRLLYIYIGGEQRGYRPSPPPPPPAPAAIKGRGEGGGGGRTYPSAPPPPPPPSLPIIWPELILITIIGCVGLNCIPQGELMVCADCCQSN